MSGWVAGFAVWMGCGAAMQEPRPAPAETAAPAPAAPVLTEAEVAVAPEVSADLHLEPGGEVVGALLAPAPPGWLRETREVDGVTWRELAPPIHGATNHGLRVWIRESSHASPPPVTAAPVLRVATGHTFDLKRVGAHGGEARFSHFFCDPIEVLEEHDGHTVVQVRSRDGFLVLRGRIEGAVAERGTGDCPPRVVTRPRRTVVGVVVTTDGAHTRVTPATPPEIEVPDGFVLARPYTLRRFPRSVYWIRHRFTNSDDGESQRVNECQRWRVQSNADGMRLSHSVREETDGGVREVKTIYSFDGQPPQMTAYAPGYEYRWIRRPPPGSGMPGEMGAMGCVSPMSIVDVTDDRITYIDAQNVHAYHPNDAGHWYRSRAACQAALGSE